jgi:hypothetical protein
MSRRANVFIDESIMPLLGSQAGLVVAVVSHGKMLQALWPQILTRIKPASVVCDQQLLANSQSIDYGRIGAWSNTGYIEVTFSRPLLASSPSLATTAQSLNREILTTASTKETTGPDSGKADALDSNLDYPKYGPWKAVITAINGRDHLNGLVRARGGIGSARHDTRQGTLDKFFAQPRPG